jgi:hypothetical protein
MDPHSLSLAVVSGKGNKDKNAFEINHAIFYGTAFCIKPNLFVTAAHVLNGAKVDGEVALARLTPRSPHIVPVKEHEIFDDIDLALLHCPGLSAVLLPFNSSPLGFHDDIFTYGYPFGLEKPNYYLRAFKGHVVTRRRLASLPAKPPGYELSLIPPPGLSGAPLIYNLPDGSSCIAGMILQQHTIEYCERQMDLGLALDTAVMRALKSKIIAET